MNTNYETRYASSPSTVKTYDTEALRAEFLIDNLMQDGTINLTYTHYDRYIAGSAVPTSVALTIRNYRSFKSGNIFSERREFGYYQCRRKRNCNCRRRSFSRWA
ncbi:hypothetical protein [Formosa algae]|uniref:hypothetical protein n=1 Tax=Formosa algae TaxID=225843 RepID=UPI0011AFCE61|nr:hypothetical protein [Formosa algae]